ncbi:MAG: hypothetical protein H6878_05545 [Rhodobiaceae bacterium]|nr:hypothetical protein [Rhodobiaceae bacterium]MCC0040541.1 hypothetical protein [Rhodobiaceae bacterium]
MPDVFSFAHTRTAFVTQKKLYEYVKTRMGTSYPRHFEDDDFIASMNVAKMHVYAAGLMDMTMFAVANAAVREAFTDDGRSALARRCFALGLDANDDGDVVPANRAQWCEDLEARMTGAVWRNTGANEHHFQASPKALVAWAPIADELKRYDADIVENSIRFAWQAVRSEFFERIDADSIANSRHPAQEDATF